MLLSAGPSWLVKVVHLAPSNRAKPREVPAHNTFSASMHNDATWSLGKPLVRVKEVRPLRRKRRSPPPSVPTQKLPAVSSTTATTALAEAPTRLVKPRQFGLSHAAQRTRPSCVPAQIMPFRS